MTDVDMPALDRELKRGAAELLLLSVLEPRPRHGYELGKRSRHERRFRTESYISFENGVCAIVTTPSRIPALRPWHRLRARGHGPAFCCAVVLRHVRIRT